MSAPERRPTAPKRCTPTTWGDIVVDNKIWPAAAVRRAAGCAGHLSVFSVHRAPVTIFGIFGP
jgi:hypothetical protein